MRAIIAKFITLNNFKMFPQNIRHFEYLNKQIPHTLHIGDAKSPKFLVLSHETEINKIILKLNVNIMQHTNAN